MGLRRKIRKPLPLFIVLESSSKSLILEIQHKVLLRAIFKLCASAIFCFSAFKSSHGGVASVETRDACPLIMFIYKTGLSRRTHQEKFGFSSKNLLLHL